MNPECIRDGTEREPETHKVRGLKTPESKKVGGKEGVVLLQHSNKLATWRTIYLINLICLSLTHCIQHGWAQVEDIFLVM